MLANTPSICAFYMPHRQPGRHGLASSLVGGQQRWATLSLNSPAECRRQLERLRVTGEVGCETGSCGHLDRLGCRILMTLGGARTVRGHDDWKEHAKDDLLSLQR